MGTRLVLEYRATDTISIEWAAIATELNTHIKALYYILSLSSSVHNHSLLEQMCISQFCPFVHVYTQYSVLWELPGTPSSPSIYMKSCMYTLKLGVCVYNYVE